MHNIRPTIKITYHIMLKLIFATTRTNVVW